MQRAALYIAYYATLVVTLAASFFPDHRVWGFNQWAYFPAYTPVTLFAIGALLPLVLVRFLKDRAGESTRETTGGQGTHYKYFVAALVGAAGLAFYVFRTTTHFLGDGYQNLAALAANPQMKWTDMGESLTHLWVKGVLGADPGAAALGSYRIISIGSGIAFLVGAALAAKELFERNVDRMLFLIGLASSGYMVLFFGYVENYSMFVASVGLFSLVGLLIAQGKLSRWLVLPPSLFAVFFHVLGTTLLPAAAYLLLADSRLGNALADRNRRLKGIPLLIAVVGGVAVFGYLYANSLYFRFAFVPLFKNRFTVEGYTLFSWKHLLDFLNLLVLLLPSLALFAVAFGANKRPRFPAEKAYRFLLILALSAIGAVFVLDPKLGMPRDWDLFSYAGMTLTVAAFYVLVAERQGIKAYVAVASLAIVLGLLSVIPRVAALNVDNVAIAHIDNYVALDRIKNSAGRTLLIQYYRKLGDKENEQAEIAARLQQCPEETLVVKANELHKQQRFGEAITVFRQALAINPIHYHAYAGIGVCYRNLKMLDSALVYLNIADGLNPHSFRTLTSLGATYLARGDYVRAEKTLNEAIAIDSNLALAQYTLAQVYLNTRDYDEYYRHLLRAVVDPEAPSYVARELGDYYLKRADYKKALKAYRLAIERGLDSTYLSKLMDQHPQLRE